MFKNRSSKGDPCEIVCTFEELDVKCESLIDFQEQQAGKEAQVVEANAYLSECGNYRCEVLCLLSRAKCNSVKGSNDPTKGGNA